MFSKPLNISKVKLSLILQSNYLDLKLYLKSFECFIEFVLTICRIIKWFWISF